MGNGSYDVYLIYLGKNVKSIRLQRELTQVEVAVEGGINPNYYGKIERGKIKNITLDTLFRIKKAYHISWKELLAPDDPILPFLSSLENDQN